MRSLLLPSSAAATEYGYGAVADPDNLYLSLQWLKVEEDTGLAQSPFYVLCLTGEGRSPAVAAAWGFSVDEANWWPFMRVDKMISRLLDERQVPQASQTASLLQSLLPNVFVGPSRGGTTSLCIHQGLSDEMAHSAVAEILAGIEAMARARGLSSIVLPYVSAEDMPLRDVLRESGYVEFGPVHNVAVLHVKGQSFDDYLSRFDYRRQVSIKAERRKIAHAGVQIGIEELSADLSQEMMPLEAQLFQRYGHPRYPIGLMTRQHAIVAKEYRGATRVITARSEGVLRGYHSLIRMNDVLYSRDCGYDYMWKKSLPLYFEVVFYSAIELAVRTGVREIAYSFGAEKVKVSRGCDLYPRLGYVKALDPEKSAELARLCADISYAEAGQTPVTLA
jgi:hypothetical protein